MHNYTAHIFVIANNCCILSENLIKIEFIKDNLQKTYCIENQETQKHCNLKANQYTWKILRNLHLINDQHKSTTANGGNMLSLSQLHNPKVTPEQTNVTFITTHTLTFSLLRSLKHLLH